MGDSPKIPDYYTKSQIKTVLTDSEILEVIEDGFIEYSNGKVITPNPGHIPFTNPPGDVHIKYGYTQGDTYYIIKIVSGFYQNPAKGLNSSNGLMMLFDQQTGALEAILHDEGYLSDVRTGPAGAIAAKYLAPKTVHKIGIVGTGIQARMQLRFLQYVTNCREVIVWGRSMDKCARFIHDMAPYGFIISPTIDIKKIPKNCNLIVTTTPACSPLLFAEDIKPGTHINAIGADNAGKQELDPLIFAKADIVGAGSIVQCTKFGDLSHAMAEQTIPRSKIWELGKIIQNPALQRQNEDQITVVDFTGIAIQDLKVTELAFKKLRNTNGLI
jgi:ornithine cyclodeaminase